MAFDPNWRALRAFALALVLATASFGLVACDDSGPAEEAGEAVDDAVEGAGEAMEDAGEAATDTLEEAGDEAEDTTN